MADDNFDDYDLDGIDRDAKAYQPPARPSQRREARKLAPLIERVLTANPVVDTAEVRRIIERNRSSGPLPNKATFNRAFANICRETRDRITRGKQANGTAPSAKRSAKPVAMSGDTMAQIAAVTPQRSPVSPAATTIGTSKHPLAIYGGTFGGRVFTHGPVIRDFFSAIEKGRDDKTLKGLAVNVQQDATSRTRLADLHPKDRSIFEAALALP